MWSNGNGGTSPVVAGGLLYVAGERRGERLRADERHRESRTLPTGTVHWQSPIVADGRVAMPEGNANDHATSGVLDIYPPAVEATGLSRCGGGEPAGPACRAPRT